MQLIYIKDNCSFKIFVIWAWIYGTWSWADYFRPMCTAVQRDESHEFCNCSASFQRFLATQYREYSDISTRVNIYIQSL